MVLLQSVCAEAAAGLQGGSGPWWMPRRGSQPQGLTVVLFHPPQLRTSLLLRNQEGSIMRA